MTYLGHFENVWTKEMRAAVLWTKEDRGKVYELLNISQKTVHINAILEKYPDFKLKLYGILV